MPQQNHTVFLIFRCLVLISMFHGDVAEVQLWVQKIGRLPWQQRFQARIASVTTIASGGSTRRHEISCQQRPSPHEEHPDSPLRYATTRCNANSQSSIQLGTTSNLSFTVSSWEFCIHQSRLTSYVHRIPNLLKFVCHSNPSRNRPNDHLETLGPGRPID